jgi:hypothetical protein
VTDAAVLAVSLAVGYLPGMALLSALSLRRPLLVLALAPAASVGLAGVVAIATAVAGLSYGPLPLGVATAALAVVAVVPALRRRGGRPRRPRPSGVAGIVTGTVLALVGVGYATWSWLQGIGSFANPPQEHDTVIHAMVVAYIARSGNGAPWEIVPADVLTGTPVSFYPAGFHLLAAASADLTGDVVASLNATTVVFLAIALCTGATALGFVAARQLGLSATSGMLVGGVAALVMAGMYRPAFHLMHDGGILGNAASLALVPGVVAGLLALPRMRLPAAVGVGVAAAGAVWVHPSAAISVGVTVVAWWAGQLVSSMGRRELRRLVVPLLVTGVTALLLVLPVVVAGLAVAGRTGAFPPDTSPVTFDTAIGATFGLPFAGFLDPAQATSQVWAVLLTAVGILTVVALRRGVGLVAAWAAWSIVTIEAWLSPGRGFEVIITGFFYNAMLRTWSHVSLLVPVLAGLGVVLVANRVAVLARRITPWPAPWTAIAVVVAGFAGYAAGPAVGYARLDEESVAARYSTPEFVRVGPDDQAAVAWLADRVRPGERVFNSPNDGSTYLYVERGIPVVNVYTLGLPGVPYSYRLLEDFRDYPTDAAVRDKLKALNVRWVYVDSSVPKIGSVGSPENWAGTAGFSLAPGLENLAGLPGLTRLFTSGTVSIYALDLAAVPAAHRP